LKSFCPCGSQQTYELCCQPYHSGSARAETALVLMCSRYSAFVLELADYLILTTAPSQRKSSDLIDLKATFQQLKWQDLKILNTELGQAKDQHGFVEFRASYSEADNQVHVLQERSHFVKEQGNWFYVRGWLRPESPPKRMAPCWCGSVKSYRKCHYILDKSNPLN